MIAARAALASLALRRGRVRRLARAALRGRRTSRIAATRRRFARRTPTRSSRTTWRFMAHRTAGSDGRGDVLFLCRWADADMPLPVYIAPPSIPDALQDEFDPQDPQVFVAAVAQALAIWERELEGLVRFRSGLEAQRRQARAAPARRGGAGGAPGSTGARQDADRERLSRAGRRSRPGAPRRRLRGAGGGALHRRLLRPARAGPGRVDRAARDRTRAGHALAQPDSRRRDVRGRARPCERARALDRGREFVRVALPPAERNRLRADSARRSSGAAAAGAAAGSSRAGARTLRRRASRLRAARTGRLAAGADRAGRRRGGRRHLGLHRVVPDRRPSLPDARSVHGPLRRPLPLARPHVAASASSRCSAGAPSRS